MQKFFSNTVNQKEVSELNNAYSAEDIPTLVSFLNSDVKLKQPLTMPHDWAPPLQTIGSLATELLAELFEDQEEEDGDGDADGDKDKDKDKDNNNNNNNNDDRSSHKM
jgi:hypothetical protein